MFECIVPQAVKKILYGDKCFDIPLSDLASKTAKDNNFDIRAYKMQVGYVEEKRESRIVRIGGIQNAIVLPTTEGLHKQYKAIEAVVEKLIDAAGDMKCNILCLQEAWTAPFFFCTREKYPWLEFAESAETGESIEFCKKMARKWNMVMICPILEIDEKHADTIWNTAVVVSNSGHVIGKHRKYHIPRVGDFNESTYYFEGNTGQSIFETQFGKIGINICYGRHFPQHWHMLGLNGAEIVFNPSATVDGLSEALWSIEARNAAIANSYFSVAINRVGTEHFPHEFTSADKKPAHTAFGQFYGSSHINGPTGQRTPPLSRTRPGLIISEVDLNLCRQVRNTWNFQMCARWEDYVRMYTEQNKLGYQPPIIRDPLLNKAVAHNQPDQAGSAAGSL